MPSKLLARFYIDTVISCLSHYHSHEIVQVLLLGVQKIFASCHTNVSIFDILVLLCTDYMFILNLK